MGLFSSKLTCDSIKNSFKNPLLLRLQTVRIQPSFLLFFRNLRMHIVVSEQQLDIL